MFMIVCSFPKIEILIFLLVYANVIVHLYPSSKSISFSWEILHRKVLAYITIETTVCRLSNLTFLCDLLNKLSNLGYFLLGVLIKLAVVNKQINKVRKLNF